MPDVQSIAILHSGHRKAQKFTQGGAHNAKAMKPLQKLCLSSDDVQYAAQWIVEKWFILVPNVYHIFQ